MGSELRLSEITTTGRRRKIRNLLFGIAALIGLIPLALLPFAGHTRGDQYIDALTATSNIPLVIGIGFEILLVIAWRGRLVRTVVITPCAALALLFAAVISVFHGSTQVKPVSNIPESVMAIMFVVTAVMCGVVFIAEWILVASEQALPDALPEARVV